MTERCSSCSHPVAYDSPFGTMERVVCEICADERDLDDEEGVAVADRLEGGARL